MTDVKLKESEPIDEQLNVQLKKVLFSFHKSGKIFFDGSIFYKDTKAVNEYED
jgi:hypothetical protein